MVTAEMSSKPQIRPAENGEHCRSKMENGMDSVAPPTLSTYTPEEMVQQMKELITENNELKGECESVSSPGPNLFLIYEFCVHLVFLDNLLYLTGIHSISNSASKADLIGHSTLNWYGRLE